MKTSSLFLIVAWLSSTAEAFHVPSKYANAVCFSRGIESMTGINNIVATKKRHTLPFTLAMAPSNETNDSGVMELVDDEDDTAVKTEEVTNAAPFLSQGEISDEALNPDLSDPKQARVIIYIIISLVPVLFLVPLMLGSRDLIPLDALPPAQM